MYFRGGVWTYWLITVGQQLKSTTANLLVAGATKCILTSSLEDRGRDSQHLHATRLYSEKHTKKSLASL